jgi:hypothetical protein
MRLSDVQVSHGMLELRGDMAAFPYYLVLWPATGPVRALRQ